MPHCTGLTRQATTGHRAPYVVLRRAIDRGHGLANDHLKNRAREIIGPILAVDRQTAAAGLDPDAGNGILPLARCIGTALGIKLGFRGCSRFGGSGRDRRFFRGCGSCLFLCRGRRSCFLRRCRFGLRFLQGFAERAAGVVFLVRRTQALLLFFEFIDATSSTSGFWASWPCSGPA